MKQKGFTLIELMIVISVTAVLGTLGIAGFTSYNKIQTLQSAANDVTTILNLARSRALSQVKLGSTCKTQTLEGYGTEIFSNNSYSLKIYCPRPTSEVLDKKTLPQGITFKSSPTTFFFPVLTGGVETQGQIVITNSITDKTIIINSLGGVTVQ